MANIRYEVKGQVSPKGFASGTLTAQTVELFRKTGADVGVHRVREVITITGNGSAPTGHVEYQLQNRVQRKGIFWQKLRAVNPNWGQHWKTQGKILRCHVSLAQTLNDTERGIFVASTAFEHLRGPLPEFVSLG